MRTLDIYQLAENINFSRTVVGGFCWEEQARKRMRNAKSLEPYGYKVYSQNDEDGIIHEIFRRIGTTNKTFIEFGVQDGLESNCHLLLFYGWKGLWIEGSERYCKIINKKFRPVIKNHQLTIKNAFVTRENINELLTDSKEVKEIDLLSIDIDGNDYYVWEAIQTVNPRVVIIEYNGKFPPDLDWKQAYNPTHIWRGDDWQGASLKAYEKLGRKKGYRLVGTDLRGVNAFFVREELAGDLFYEPATAEALYNPLRKELSFCADHPAKYCLAVQKEGLGLLNYQQYELVEGFYKEEESNDTVWVWTCATKSIIKFLVESDLKYIEIPYLLPDKVLCMNESYLVSVFINSSEVLRQKIYSESGILKITMESALTENSTVELQIYTPFLWKPCEILGNSDQRNLGIGIVLSEIRML